MSRQFIMMLTINATAACSLPALGIESENLSLRCYKQKIIFDREIGISMLKPVKNILLWKNFPALNVIRVAAKQRSKVLF